MRLAENPNAAPLGPDWKLKKDRARVKIMEDLDRAPVKKRIPMTDEEFRKRRAAKNEEEAMTQLARETIANIKSDPAPSLPSYSNKSTENEPVRPSIPTSPNTKKKGFFAKISGWFKKMPPENETISFAEAQEKLGMEVDEWDETIDRAKAELEKHGERAYEEPEQVEAAWQSKITEAKASISIQEKAAKTAKAHK